MNYLDKSDVLSVWSKGRIVGVKEKNAYYLTCDAADENVIFRLREMLGEPKKPFHLMYHDIYELGEDVEMDIAEMLELESATAPIVLLAIKKSQDRMTKLALNAIAPEANLLGVKMPKTTFYKTLLSDYKKPIVFVRIKNNSEYLAKKTISSLADAFVLNAGEEEVNNVIRYSSIKYIRNIVSQEDTFLVVAGLIEKLGYNYKELEKKQVEKQLQSSKASFFALLAEHELLTAKENILGVILQNTNELDNEPEFVLYRNSKFTDSLNQKSTEEVNIVGLLKKTAFLLLDLTRESYEGEAVFLLENAAYRYFRTNNFTKYYSYLKENKIPKEFTKNILQNLKLDIAKGYKTDFIAAKIHITIAHYITLVSNAEQVSKVCFTGGVFKNLWLVELLIAFMKPDFELFFHKDLPSSKENNRFGQLMYYLYHKNN